MKLKISTSEFTQICLTLFSTFFLITTNMCKSSVQKTIVFFTLCLMYFLLKNIKLFKYELASKTALAFFLFEIYILIFSTISYNIFTAFNTVLSQFVYLGGAVLFFALVNRLKPPNFLVVVCSVVIIWVFADLKVLLLCRSYPNIARYIVAGMVDSEVICSVAAPYALAQSSCFIVIALVNLLTKRKNKLGIFPNVIIISCVVVMAITVYEIQSTITTLIMISGCVVAVFLNIFSGRDGLTQKKKICLSIAIVVLGCIFMLFKKSIGICLINRFENGNSVFAGRLSEIGHVLSSANLSSDLSARLELAQKSLQAFVRNPILGNLYTNGTSSGGHCAILDLFSDYGLVGGLPFILFFVFYFRRLKKILHNFDIFIWIPFFVMSWLNPVVLYQPYFSILFVVPALYYVFEKYNKRELCRSV